MLQVVDLKCEQLKNPVGIRSQIPEFSWKLKSDRTNIMQTKYKITVYREGNVFWQGDIISSSCSVGILYSGQDLSPLTKYEWETEVWDNQGNYATGRAFFITSRYSLPWKASWVEPEQHATFVQNEEVRMKDAMGIRSETRGMDDYEGFQPVQYLRIPFILKKKVYRVLICATSHGVYELKVNGTLADDRKYAPEFSPYEKLLMYQVYDVTDSVGYGENIISVILGDGWWSGRVGYIGDACQYGDRTAFLLEGKIEYEDGTEEYILSDQAVSSTGPLLVSDLFVGEKYDAHKELDGWELAGFDDSLWKQVKRKDYGYSNLVAQTGEPVREISVFEPAEIKISSNGEVIIDAGQNLAGYLSFQVEASDGDVIRLEYTEALDRNGCFCRNIMGANKDQTDVYIAKAGKQSYCPSFTYHGFRYARLSGWPGALDVKDFKVHVVATDMENTGIFVTSNEKLNRLQQNIRWSQISNTVSIPTDCPQREKAGWTGDVLVYAPTMSYNQNCYAFLRRWLEYCRLEQQEKGEIPTVVPFLQCYKEMNRFLGSNTSCGWGDVIVSVPWTLYQAFANKRILEENYEAMKQWMRYVQDRAENEVIEEYESFDEERKKRQKYLWNTGFHYGDWLVPSSVLNTDDDMAMINSAYRTKKIVAPAYYAYSTDLMAKIAHELCKEDDERYYRALNLKIREAFEAEYISSDGRVDTDLQGAYILVLKNSLVSEKLRIKVLERLCEKIAENDGCLDAGFLSIPFFLDVLSENGRRDVAYDLLYQEKCPSWLYEVNHGATTIWESWGAIGTDGKIGKYSLNHYAYGCVGCWMYRTLAGIKATEPGYRSFKIDPAYDCGLDYVKASLETPYGTMASEWKKDGDMIQLRVMVPPNTKADIVTSDGVQRVGSGEWNYLILGKDCKLKYKTEKTKEMD